jgi:hypothetical protein
MYLLTIVYLMRGELISAQYRAGSERGALALERHAITCGALSVTVERK